MIRHLVNIISWFLPPSRLFALRTLLLRVAGIEMAPGVKVCGRGWIYGRGRVRLGAGTWLSPGVIIHSHLEAMIEIGERCDLGPGVELITGSHEIGSSARRAGPGTAKPIQIGPGCWIGAGTKILGGVSIGEGSIVAAGAIVTRNVAANTLVAGVPASVKKTLG